MKKHLGNRIFTTLLILFLCTTMGFSQTIAIENDKQNFAYHGLYAYLTIVVEGIPCDQIMVTTDNGTMEYRGNCSYEYRSQQVGVASIFINKIDGKDTILIGERKYRIKPWPIQDPEIGGRTSGTMGLGQFKAQEGILVPIGLDVQGLTVIKCFRMLIIRNCEVISSVINYGNRFEEKTRLEIDKIQVNDKVIFDQIEVKYPGNESPVTAKTLVIEIN